jgi:hypothetical protein
MKHAGSKKTEKPLFNDSMERSVCSSSISAPLKSARNTPSMHRVDALRLHDRVAPSVGTDDFVHSCALDGVLAQ